MRLSPLPIDSALPDLMAALRRRPSAVLTAPPGAGKTTRVPPALLAAGMAGKGQVIVAEPRRVAARAAARRMAAELGRELGAEVGYQVRFDRKAGAETRILVVTEGVLVNLLQADPFLEGVGALVFDEFHERNLPSDLALAMAKRVQKEVREDLKLVVMSATLEAELVAAWLGDRGLGEGTPGSDVAIVDSPGRQYPVEVEYLSPREAAELAAEASRFGGSALPTGRALSGLVARSVAGMLPRTPGDLLVFLPGVGEIRGAAEALEGMAAREGFDVRPLYGDLPPGQQDAALAPSPDGRRKVVLATNVAESSVTVEGVTAVIDSGLARVMRYDPGTGLDRLELARVSADSAEQRAGRAGRQAPGRALRLWTEHDQRSLAPALDPEIRRVDLAGPALQLLAWGEEPRGFDWLTPPDPAALEQALELLGELGALGKAGLTELGRRMARLPVHPRLARLALAGHDAGVGRDAALLAALVSERDPFPRSRGGFQGGTRGGSPPPSPSSLSSSDLLGRLDALRRFEGGRGDTGDLNRGAARFLLRARDQLARALKRDGGREGGSALEEPAADRDEALLRSLLAAYPDRVARRREADGEGVSKRGVMVGGRGVVLSDSSALAASPAELFLCVELDAGRRGERAEARVRRAAEVRREWLDPSLLRETVEVVFDEERRRAVGRKRLYYQDLVLEEKEAPAPPDEAARVLTRAAAERLDEALPLDSPDVASLLARTAFLRRERPDLDLPDLGSEKLRELLPALTAGRRSFADLASAPLADILRGLLSQAQAAALAREAPERIEVPSGSRIRVDYSAVRDGGDGPPVLAVRIQELFGMEDTPRLAGGRVPVLLHLLAPNGRPQQITQDLAGFWTRTYPEVKKELAGRYPKHAWPDDPRTARAERRPGRRRG